MCSKRAALKDPFGQQLKWLLDEEACRRPYIFQRFTDDGPREVVSDRCIAALEAVYAEVSGGTFMRPFPRRLGLPFHLRKPAHAIVKEHLAPVLMVLGVGLLPADLDTRDTYYAEAARMVQLALRQPPLTLNGIIHVIGLTLHWIGATCAPPVPVWCRGCFRRTISGQTRYCVRHDRRFDEAAYKRARRRALPEHLRQRWSKRRAIRRAYPALDGFPLSGEDAAIVARLERARDSWPDECHDVVQWLESEAPLLAAMIGSCLQQAPTWSSAIQAARLAVDDVGEPVDHPRLVLDWVRSAEEWLELGWEPSPRGRPRVALDLAEAKALRSQGLSLREIASRLRVSRETIRTALGGQRAEAYSSD